MDADEQAANRLKDEYRSVEHPDAGLMAGAGRRGGRLL